MAEVMCAGEDIGTRYRYKKTGRNAHASRTASLQPGIYLNWRAVIFMMYPPQD